MVIDDGRSASTPTKVLLFFSLIVIVCLATTLSVAADQSAEREALMALYNNTNGDGWNNNSGWGTGVQYCNWFGILCDNAQHVVKIDLSHNNLSGPIPAELGNLSELEWLSLIFNDLSGPIPAQLGNLSNLVELYLVSNNLSGSIPPELGNLNNLDSLALLDNSLTGPIPASLGNLSNIVEIDLSDNSLGGSIPRELGSLSSLEQLRLDSNSLTGPIPPELPNLINLRWLGLANNDLSGPIPAELSNLSNLLRLFIDGNARLACWETEDALIWAQGLSPYFGPADVCATDHDSLMALFNSAAGEAWTDNTDWGTTIDPCLAIEWHGVSCDSGRVSMLELNANNLNGSIPPELGNLTNLVRLSLQNNNLVGRIPAALANLSSLHDLWLAGNPFLCWETQNAAVWALNLADFSGPEIVCRYIHLPITIKK